MKNLKEKTPEEVVKHLLNYLDNLSYPSERTSEEKKEIQEMRKNYKDELLFIKQTMEISEHNFNIINDEVIVKVFSEVGLSFMDKSEEEQKKIVRGYL